MYNVMIALLVSVLIALAFLSLNIYNIKNIIVETRATVQAVQTAVDKLDPAKIKELSETVSNGTATLGDGAAKAVTSVGDALSKFKK